MHHVTFLQIAWLYFTDMPSLLLALPVSIMLLIIAFESRLGMGDRIGFGLVGVFAIALTCSIAAFLPQGVADICRVLNSTETRFIAAQNMDGNLSVVVGVSDRITESPAEILGKSVTVENIIAGKEIRLNQHMIDGLSRLNYKPSGAPIIMVKVASTK